MHSFELEIVSLLTRTGIGDALQNKSILSFTLHIFNDEKFNLDLNKRPYFCETYAFVGVQYHLQNLILLKYGKKRHRQD